jgi:phosphoglycerate dehydrogenase-like enzyme
VIASAELASYAGWADHLVLAAPAATLDVFGTGPLPADSPLWEIPWADGHRSHMSGDVVGWQDTLARQFADNAQRWLAGEPLQNVVDKDLGYITGGKP